MPQPRHKFLFMKRIADISTGEGTPEKRVNGKKEHRGNTQHRKQNGPNSLRWMNQREGRHDQRIYIKHVLLQKGFGMSVMGTRKGCSQGLQEQPKLILTANQHKGQMRFNSSCHAISHKTPVGARALTETSKFGSTLASQAP